MERFLSAECSEEPKRLLSALRGGNGKRVELRPGNSVKSSPWTEKDSTSGVGGKLGYRSRSLPVSMNGN